MYKQNRFRRDGIVRDVRRDTMILAARMVRNATWPIGRAGTMVYDVQAELADMLESVADGVLTGASIRAYLAGESETPEVKP